MRKFLLIVVPFLLTVMVSCKPREEQKLNLLIIMTDQQRFDALSIAGNSVLETPNLDRLAKQGAFFKNAYTPCAVCAPARSTILTGYTVEHTGMRTNDRAYNFKEEGLMSMPTFDEILTENGYRCEYYGKWHSQTPHTSIYKNPKQHAKNGNSVFEHGGQNYVYMDYINAYYPKMPLKPGELYDTFTKRPYEPNPLDNCYGMSADECGQKNSDRIQPDLHGKLLTPKEYSFTAFQAMETLEAIERLKDSTFSITCSFHFPHAPMLPVEPYSNMYPAEEMIAPVSISDDMENSPYKATNGRLGLPEYADKEKIKFLISNYYGLVKEIDDWVGVILDKLEELGLADKTLVIFTSDHGEMLGSHGMREKNVFYEESAHIPLIMRLPVSIEKNRQIDAYVSTIDIFPSILDYLHIEEHPCDGKSLRGLIEETDEQHGQYVVTEWDYRGDISPNYMVLKDGWKLMIPYTASSTVINALYDLNSDPYEMNNLIGKNPDRTIYKDKTEELKACLLEWLKQHNSKHFEGVLERDLMQ